jgi:DNA polymerase-3 subunit delta'
MLEDLAGNENIKTILRRLAANSRMPNSMLFAGMEGVGKREFALEVARAMVCKAEPRACGKCAACLRVGSVTIPEASSENRDLFKKVIYSEYIDVGTVVPFRRAILVEAIRDLERAAYFSPYEADARVFIIDDAHKMNDNAANALLKTLEEPAATTHIILVTSSPDSLLQTILSRCQVFRFEPIATNLVFDELIKTGKFSKDDAQLAAAVSGGSIGRALTIDAESYRLRRRSMIDALAVAAGRGGRERLFLLSEELTDAKNKDDFEESLGVLQDLIHDAWLAAYDPDATDFRNADISNEIRMIAANIEPSRFAEWMDEIESLRENLIVNINKRVATDALFLRIAA